MDDFNKYITLLCSNDSDVQTRALGLLVAVSFTQPDIIISHINELRMVLTLFCASPEPCWGSISLICQALATAINLQKENIADYFLSLIHISSDITRAAFSYGGANIYYPQINLLTEAMVRAYKANFQITEEIFLALTDHCLIGYIRFSSLVESLIDHFQQVVQIVRLKSDYNVYSKIAAGISCNDKDAVLFYLALWTILMTHWIDRPLAIRALREQSARLLQLVNQPPPFHEPAHFLINCIKATSKEKESLGKQARDISEAILTQLKQNRKVTKAAEIKLPKKVEQPTAAQAKKVQIVEVSFLTTGKMTKEKWHDGYFMSMIDEAQILYWSKNSKILDKGVAIFLADIKNINITQAKRKERKRENVLLIKTKSDNEYYLAFSTYQIGNDWFKMIQHSVSLLNNEAMQ